MSSRAAHRALPRRRRRRASSRACARARQRARKAARLDATAPRLPRQSISTRAVDAQELLFAVENWLPAHMLSQTMWKRFPTKTFSDGEPVQARFRGRATFYDAYIARARDDGTYDLAYADGENEYNVKPEFIRALSEEQLAAVRAREAAKREQAANRRNKVKKKEAMERAAAKAAAKAAASGAAKATGGAAARGKGGAAAVGRHGRAGALRQAQVNNSRLHKSASDGYRPVISRRAGRFPSRGARQRDRVACGAPPPDDRAVPTRALPYARPRRRVLPGPARRPALLRLGVRSERVARRAVAPVPLSSAPPMITATSTSGQESPCSRLGSRCCPHRARPLCPSR